MRKIGAKDRDFTPEPILTSFGLETWTCLRFHDEESPIEMCVNKCRYPVAVPAARIKPYSQGENAMQFTTESNVSSNITSQFFSELSFHTLILLSCPLVAMILEYLGWAHVTFKPTPSWLKVFRVKTLGTYAWNLMASLFLTDVSSTLAISTNPN